MCAYRDYVTCGKGGKAKAVDNLFVVRKESIGKMIVTLKIIGTNWKSLLFLPFAHRNDNYIIFY